MSGLYCNLGSTLTSNKEGLWLLTDTSTISRFILGDPGADTGGDRKSKWAKIEKKKLIKNIYLYSAYTFQC